MFVLVSPGAVIVVRLVTFWRGAVVVLAGSMVIVLLALLLMVCVVTSVWLDVVILVKAASVMFEGVFVGFTVGISVVVLFSSVISECETTSVVLSVVCPVTISGCRLVIF